MNTTKNSPRKHTVFYIQPILAGYRAPIIKKLASIFETSAFYDNSDAIEQGHMAVSSDNSTTVQSPSISLLGGRLFYQKNVVLRVFQDKPDAVITFANPRFISFWMIMIACRILNLKFYAHGQGLYAYTNPSKFRKMMYKTICRYSTKYVCYTELSKKSLLDAECLPEKLITIKNSLELETTVTPNQKKYTENGVLFIGRLRDGCRLDILIKAIQLSRNNGADLELHVIGSGQLTDHYMNHYKNISWIHWHGAVHNNHDIAKISKLCRIGCYPGDAGLSIVHYLSLGLPPLVHHNIENHMGPEPSYITNNENGFLFDPKLNEVGLSAVLDHIWQLPTETIKNVANASFATYLDLNNPPMGDQFVKLVLENKCKL